MKKQIIVLGSLFFFLVLSGCGQKTAVNERAKSNGEASVQKKEVSEEGLFSGSIKELVARGKNSQCTFSIGDETNKMKGTIYVSGNRFLQEFSSIQGEMGEVKNYVLSDGEWIYQWNSLSKTGIKMQIAEMERVAKEVSDKNPEIKTQSKNGGEFNSTVDYDCQKWILDAAKLELPADVVFSNPPQLINPTVDADSKNGDCQACEFLPGETKEACLRSCQK